MPWHVSRSEECPPNRPFAVIKDSDGSVEACHVTEDDANDQVKALYSAEMRSKAQEFLRLPELKEATDGREEG